MVFYLGFNSYNIQLNTKTLILLQELDRVALWCCGSFEQSSKKIWILAKIFQNLILYNPAKSLVTFVVHFYSLKC